MRPSAFLLAVLLAASPAFAQRAAVSADLSPEAAADVFRRTVLEVCVPAATGGGVSASPAAQSGKLRTTNDAATRRQAGADPSETVWDVMDARGVVTVHEKAGRCVVSVYGAVASPTIEKVAQALVGPPGFQRMAVPQVSASGLEQTLHFSSNGRAVFARLSGSEPGMPGHQSRFSVVTATVFVAQ